MLTFTQGGPPDLSKQFSWTPVDKSLETEPKMEEFWNLETIGIQSPSTKQTTDTEVLKSFNDTVTFIEGRYQVTWPWKDPEISPPDNFQLALGRLQSLLRKRGDNKELLAKYDAIIQDQLKKCIIEPVTSDSFSSKKHYIPHHAVITPDRATTKVRIVYDASAKTKKTNNSLDDCLYRGPVILGDICGLLLRFRLEKIGLISDIEKAFLQVGLQDHDRDVTRFLWLKNPLCPDVQNNLQIYRFAGVPFGVVSSPFLLAATVNYHLGTLGTPTCEKIRQNMYVDNAITGVKLLEEAQDFYQEAKDVFSQASMNLREWVSNSQEFMSSISEVDRVKDAEVKVLGLKWNTKADTFTVPGQSKLDLDASVTKRSVIKQIATVFDPLGFFCPVTIRAKIFLQKLWEESHEWDESLSEKVEEWRQILVNIKETLSLQIPRFFNMPEDNPKSYQLVGFCDASARSCCTVIYLRVSSKDSTSVHFLFAKSRLAPVRKISIPRLELVALVIGSRSLQFLEKQLRLPIEAKYMWSDSMCALQWLQTNEKLPVFVSNRVKEIKQYDGVQFRFVPGSENSADLGTRGLSSDEFRDNQVWWQGPAWLQQKQENWPSIKVYDVVSENEEPRQDENAKNPTPSRVFYEASLVNADCMSHPFEIDPQRYSSLSKLLRITSYCMRFLNRMMKKHNRSSSLTVEELQESREMWEKSIQNYIFEDKCDKENTKQNPIINQLGLQKDRNGIWRCYGRFLNLKTAQPKLLPPKHPFTKLVIQDVHEKLFHSGTSHTLANIRKNYWIPKGRSEVQRYIRSCLVCRREDGGPYKMPNMAPLPMERISQSPPFTFTAIGTLFWAIVC